MLGSDFFRPLPCSAPVPPAQRIRSRALLVSCTSTPAQPAPDALHSKRRRSKNRGGSLSVEDLALPTGDWTARIPIVGETFSFIADAAEWCNSRVKKHGPVFKTSLFGYEGYCVANFDLIEEIYESIHHSTVQFQLPAFGELMAGPLTKMTYEKDAHVKLRRQFGAALSADAVASYLPAIENLARTYTSKWAEEDTIDLERALRDITMDYSSDLVVGLGLDKSKKAALKHHFANFTKNLNTFNVDLPGTPLRTAKIAKKEVLAAIRDEVQAVRDKALAGDFGARGTKTTLQNYIQGKLRDDNEVDEVDTLAIVVLNLLVAGYDTSAWSMLSLFGIYLQVPQHIKDKLKAEQDAVLAKHGETLDRYAMADMRYADAFIKEALRLKGPVPLLMKQAKTDLALNGQRIPQGSILFMSILTALHSDTQTIKQGPNKGAKVPREMDIYDLEHSFKPERWLDPATTPTNHGQFAGGIHSCLGAPLYTAEAKVLLAVLTRHYSTDLVSGPIVWQPGTNIAPVDPIQVRLRPLAIAAK